MDKESARQLEDAFEAIERALDVIYDELRRLGRSGSSDVRPVGRAADYFGRLRRQLTA